MSNNLRQKRQATLKAWEAWEKWTGQVSKTYVDGFLALLEDLAEQVLEASEDCILLPNGQKIQRLQGGCYSIGSDRYPINIIDWSASGKTLYYQRAKSKRVDCNGQSECQEYIFAPDHYSRIQVATWRSRDQCYRERGSRWGSIWVDGYDCYRDPSF
ncbi:MAG: hypothetical protein CMJ75_22890 [Planctomycetaceae bacterium]|nr:hypothetical protein [Planctomycetaceae bacterium]